MRRFPFHILIILSLAFTGAFAMACGDLDGEEGASCDPEEEAPEGFICTCEDDTDVDTCSLETDEDTNNTNNNNAENPTVNIANAAFSPNSLSITTGSTVTWTNNDPDLRNISSDNANLDINIEPGDSAVFVFNDPGSYIVVDRINSTNLPNLRMTITVR